MPKPTILAIDDSPISRKIYECTLSSGFQTLLSEDAESALSLLSSTPCDLLICDVNLPGMSGLDLLKSLRANTAYSQIPFIIVSSDGEGIASAKALGVELWLLKPVNPRALLNAVNKALKKQ